MKHLERLISHPAMEWGITLLIALNAVILGLETSPAIIAATGGWLALLDSALLIVFTCELSLRMVVLRRRFLTNGWALFDFLVIGISWLPTTGAFSVLRALRVLRVLRLISAMPEIRQVVGALVGALPGMGAIFILLALIFYVFSVISTHLFGQQFPQWFGSMGESAYSLFQIMTLESWSMGIVRPVMQIYPQAWLFFVPFILCTTFTVLNLMIAVVVNAMETLNQRERKQQATPTSDQEGALSASAKVEASPAVLEQLLVEVRALRQQVEAGQKRT